MTEDNRRVSTSNLKRIQSWFSNLFVGFLATYIVGIWSTIIPVPKQLICKLFPPFCPQEVIIFNASDPDFINNYEGVGQAPSMEQVGMIHNETEFENVERYNMIEYKFPSNNNNQYQVAIRYTNVNKEPVKVYVNGILLDNITLFKKTKSYDNIHRIYSKKDTISLKKGMNLLKIESSGKKSIPHLSKFEFKEIM